MRLGEAAQYRLQIVLRAQAVQHRRGSAVGRRHAARDAALDLAPGEALGPDDKAGPLRREAGFADRRLDAELAVHLHRAGVDAARFRQDRRAGMTLDEQRAHAVPRQQKRGGQPDRAAADNQNRDYRLIAGRAGQSLYDGIEPVGEPQAGGPILAALQEIAVL